MIAKRLFLQIILMVILSIIPLRRRPNLSRDRLSFIPLLPDLLLDLFRNPLLILILVENRTPILRPRVGALSIQRRRIVHAEEILDHLSIAHFARVERNQQTLRVACSSTADRAVVGCFRLAACVADTAVQEAFTLPVFAVEFFEAPEAAAGEDGSFGAGGEVAGCEGVGD